MTAPFVQAARGGSAIWRDDDGASAVEFSIVGMIFVVLLVGVLELGWALQVQNEISQAADHAARQVIMAPETSDTAFEAKVYDALEEYDPERLSVDVGEMTVGAAEFRTLNVEYSFPVSVPGFPASLLTLRQSRRIPVLEP